MRGLSMSFFESPVVTHRWVSRNRQKLLRLHYYTLKLQFYLRLAISALTTAADRNLQFVVIRLRLLTATHLGPSCVH
jgi:hypothetical protein